MDRNILSRNILIQEQIAGIAGEFAKTGVNAVLMKGAALILCFPGYAKTRNMEDIDMLVRQGDMAKARECLMDIGYNPVQEDPSALGSPKLAASVDISDNLWYLDGRENKELFNNALRFPIEGFSGRMFHLEPEDFYVHVLAHGALHHAMQEGKWKQDLALMSDRWGKKIDMVAVERKLEVYGFAKAARIYLSQNAAGGSLYARVLRLEDNPWKGHVTRFVFLPFRKKVNYVLAAVFPTREFLSDRYNLKNRREVLLFQILRPFLLIRNFFLFAKSLLFPSL